MRKRVIHAQLFNDCLHIQSKKKFHMRTLPLAFWLNSLFFFLFAQMLIDACFMLLNMSHTVMSFIAVIILLYIGSKHKKCMSNDPFLL